MRTYVETIIIGGGQAGLSVSYYLSQQDQQHIVLEQAAEPAEAWRNHRWDSFTLNTPNWQSVLPGAELPDSNPDGFLSREAVVRYLEDYVKRHQLPVRYGVRVGSVEQNKAGHGYIVQTNVGEFEGRNVVVATGLYQSPKIPAASVDFPPSIRQMHSDHYRNPESLPAGSVLVVGSAQSGAQIAEELNQARRKVYLSVSGAGRVPRRYRGKDANQWHYEMGDYDRTVDQLPSPKAKFGGKPHISGKNGGHTINLHQFARDGVLLLGRVNRVQGENLILAADLKENLAKADKFEADFAKSVDEFVTKHGINAPEEKLPELRDGYESPNPAVLNLSAANITSVIWATGYKFDFSLVHLPVLDDDGYPIQKRGVTAHPGLYFIGLPWLHNAKSGLIFGLEQDASHIAGSIVERSRRVPTPVRRRSPAARTELEFEGKVALITGGTTGIGAATAKYVADLGAKVVVTGRHRQRGHKVVDDIESYGGEAVFFEADLSLSEQVHRIVPFIVNRFGRLDFAFNNGGTSGENGLLIDQTEDNFDRVFSVNVKSLFVLLHDEIRQMIRQGRGGSIVNAASVSALVATSAASHYIASKHAVLGLTKAAAIEYGQYGIRVNAVSPGAVRTEMLLDVFGSEEAINRMSAVHPLGRIGSTHEIGAAVAWLFSENSSYYTGQSLTLDGGLTAQRPFAAQSLHQNGQRRSIGITLRTQYWESEYEI